MKYYDWKTYLSCRLVGIMLVIFCIASSVGCASNTKLPPSQQTLLTRELQPPDGKSLVYFYYEKFSTKPTEVVLNEVASEIKRNSYIVWEIEPGTYPLEFKFQGGTWLSEVVTITMTCEAGQVYYFHLTGIDKETHQIVPVDTKTGQKKIRNFDLISWFKDGVLVKDNAEE